MEHEIFTKIYYDNLFRSNDVLYTISNASVLTVYYTKISIA